MRGSPELLTMRSQREQIESASPIAFAEYPHFARVHTEYHSRLRDGPNSRVL